MNWEKSDIEEHMMHVTDGNWEIRNYNDGFCDIVAVTKNEGDELYPENPVACHVRVQDAKLIISAKAFAAGWLNKVRLLRRFEERKLAGIKDSNDSRAPHSL